MRRVRRFDDKLDGCAAFGSAFGVDDVGIVCAAGKGLSRMAAGSCHTATSDFCRSASNPCAIIREPVNTQSCGGIGLPDGSSATKSSARASFALPCASFQRTHNLNRSALRRGLIPLRFQHIFRFQTEQQQAQPANAKAARLTAADFHAFCRAAQPPGTQSRPCPY